MQLETIKTAALIVEVAWMNRNSERVSNRANELNVNLPQMKTHHCAGLISGVQ